jgi:serine/threonine protein kinase, bacterial
MRPPRPPKPPAAAVAIPARSGSAFVVTKSGKTACQIRAEVMGSQVDWSVPTPIQCCGPAIGVQVNASDWKWMTGDMGDQLYTTLAYGTEYRSLDRAIAPYSDGTTFTHDATGPGTPSA